MLLMGTAALKSWKTYLTLGCLTLLLVLGWQFLPRSVAAPATSELRGVWLTNIDSDVLFSRDRLRKGLRQLTKLQFNTVYPTVWNWGYTLYPSAVAEKYIGERQRLYPDLAETGKPSPLEPTQRDRNMLQEAIKIAKKQRLTVIPWFEFGFMAPADSELARRHPAWITQRADGTTKKMEGTHPRVWLNPFHPEVQQFILDLVTELVRDYDVAGIQFDDHFGLPAEFGYDPYTVKLYQAEHNGKSPPADASDPEWTRWRADKITAVMARAFAAIKAVKPSALVSLSPNPAEFAYETFLQDWVTWERRGYVEEVVIQVYRTERDRFLMEIERPEVVQARQHIPVSIGILAGLKNREISVDWIQEQVELVRDRQFAGVAFFFYETLWQPEKETRQQRQDKLRQLFATPAHHPSHPQT